MRNLIVAISVRHFVNRIVSWNKNIEFISTAGTNRMEKIFFNIEILMNK